MTLHQCCFDFNHINTKLLLYTFKITHKLALKLAVNAPRFGLAKANQVCSDNAQTADKQTI